METLHAGDGTSCPAVDGANRVDHSLGNFAGEGRMNIAEVEQVLKEEILFKETNLMRYQWGIRRKGTDIYLSTGGPPCLLGCYLLGKKKVTSFPREDYVLTADAALYLGITDDQARCLIKGFDSYRVGQDYQRGDWPNENWHALGWRIAVWADELGMLVNTPR